MLHYGRLLLPRCAFFCIRSRHFADLRCRHLRTGNCAAADCKTPPCLSFFLLASLPRSIDHCSLPRSGNLSSLPRSGRPAAGRQAGLAVGGWRLAVGGWRPAAGGWRLAAGGWRLAAPQSQTPNTYTYTKDTPIGNTRSFMQITRVPPCEISIFPYKSKGHRMANTCIFIQILRVPHVKYVYFHTNPKDTTLGNIRIFM